jgi:hypothetical protein
MLDDFGRIVVVPAESAVGKRKTMSLEWNASVDRTLFWKVFASKLGWKRDPKLGKNRGAVGERFLAQLAARRNWNQEGKSSLKFII